MSESGFDRARFLESVSNGPGVYRMLDARGEILYVGKARSLKKRLASYFRASEANPKTLVMRGQIADIQVTVTHTETEALLLENNLIKQHRPRYNVVLRDDKSYPYIRLDDSQAFQRLTLYRGRRKEAGRYFGPYPSAYSARETVNLLQKLFQLRQCNDTFFKNRSRPCLQYQIKRCSAPCVGFIGEEAYRRDTESAALFLQGKTGEVVDSMVTRMEEASARTDYELAARYRDQIASLRKTAAHQSIEGDAGDYDVVAAAGRAGAACVLVMFVRAGRHLGNQAFHPRVSGGETAAELIDAFLPQYYLGREIPPDIILAEAIEDADMVAAALGTQAGHAVAVRSEVRGERRRLQEMARVNAEQALALRLAMDAGMRKRFEALQEALELEQMPSRLECFDISHTMGEGTVASCVVFDTEGPRKSDYRRFNIDGIQGGDDYGAMRQALSRRYTRLKRGEGLVPDVLFIDGGKGQLHEAEKVLEDLQVEGVTLASVAKGSTRRPGMEQLFLSGREAPLILPQDSPALHLIQQIRDEAHRFAITGHRQRRAKARNTSPLEEVPGLGPKRRQALLKHFGGLQAVTRAGVEDLASVPGVSRELAQRIYGLFHAEE
ncbi:MAG TPA: excinuclease ABC subunit UvrC [Gammaproteobacteria bacterium]|jgi:excinuclease ABC subunit C|nr:excinuclease ABC subunit UvrC [Gammaproteobacteria bacterium]